MKTRTDFVSNSSSSSFVVACQKQYLKDIAKDLAKACTNKKDACHNKDLAKRNQRILDFCLNTFQLLFVGELLVKTNKTILTYDSFKKSFSSCGCGMSDDAIHREWEIYKKDLIDVKSGKINTSWLKREHELDEYDSLTDTIVHYKRTYVNNIVVSNGIMEYSMHRYNFPNGPDDDKTIKHRVDNIMKLAENKSKCDSRYDCFEEVEVYQITKSTLANTRELISLGHTVELADWENLDALEARIDHGDAIFYVRIAQSGDGYGDFYIYCEDDADGLDGVSGVEILTSECM